MFEDPTTPVLAFVWQPREIGKRVVDMSRSTSTTAIFDITFTEPQQVAAVLKAACARDIKVCADFLADPSSDGFLEEAAVETLWVECLPSLFLKDQELFIKRLMELETRLKCIPVSGDLGLLTRFVQMDQPLRAIALKGSEASGFVSSETTGILFTVLHEMMNRRKQGPDLILWGGIATPEAAAAFLTTGARGIVFESLHWQTDMVAMDKELRQRIARLRPEWTTVVGASLGAPCRLFDKGNSLAVKNLRRFAATLDDGTRTDQARNAFVQRVMEQITPALESNLEQQDLVPLGPEVAFAEAFADRFGRSTAQAMEGFVSEVARQCRDADQAKGRFLDSPVAKEMGTAYPIIQGAMSWITDVPEFARAVAMAGGLPTLALGFRNRQQLEGHLRQLKEVLAGRTYAVNIVALAENPYLDEQLQWIEEVRPPFAVIGAGDPVYAARLRANGIEVIYIAPDEGLLRMALNSGVRYVVLEGNEAGGHVGAHSALTLAQIALNLKRREPGLFKNGRVVLAGGIFNRETAFRAAMLGADAIQLGTAYLATQEIVATGALSPLYQHMILQSEPGTTLVTGESIALRVRSLNTHKMSAIEALERKFIAGDADESSFRRQLEMLSANSLLIAAHGTEHLGGPTLDEATCLKEGQFMSGAVAGAISRVRAVAELHKDLVEGPSAVDMPRFRQQQSPATITRPGAGNGRERIAITGMALVNSLGNSPLDVWNAAIAMKSGIIEVPSSKWDHSQIYSPKPNTPEKTYCKVGAFQDISISREDLDIPPQDFRTMANSTKLTMWLARQVILDSGILKSDIPRERIGVIVSQNSGELPSTVADLVIGMSAKHIVQALGDVIPLSADLELALEQRIKSGRLSVDDTTVLGRLNSSASGFICNKHRFTGPSYAVSAACATSLVALFSAVQMIRTGTVDAMLVGGGEESLNPAHYLEFSALGALSGISGVERPPEEASRPFDAMRDGMVLGEGGAMIVIERESMARRRGARIHGYITGIGASNNDRGMVESLAETQVIAMRASFEDVPYGPDDVDLVECHATSTVQGDIEEVKALKGIFPRGKHTVLTSFKSQIGHTLGASGLNNLIHGILAMQAGVLPPTLNYWNPDPQIALENWGFHVPTQPIDWPRPPRGSRRLMAESFGFGGPNYVVQLEECMDGVATVAVSLPKAPQTSHEGIASVEEDLADLEGVSLFRTQISGRPYRVAVLTADPREAEAKLTTLQSHQQSHPLSARDRGDLARQGIFLGLEDQPCPPLALVFTGQGSYYPGMGKELYECYASIRMWMDRLAAVADFDILNLLFNSGEEELWKTRWQQPALFTMEYAMARHLLDLGVRPVAMAGHSLGEMVALCVAGVFSYEDGFRIVDKRAQCMDKASKLKQDPGTMIAVDAPLGLLKEKLTKQDNVYITNYNSPRQVVLGGGTEEVLGLKEELAKEGYWTAQLRVSMAFHSPIMRVIRDEMEEFLSGIVFHAPTIPVISNTTMERYPDDPAEIRKVLITHLESPVHWVQNVKSLWNDLGIRLFVEVGPKDTLCNLIAETIKGAQCISTSQAGEEAHKYRVATAQLYALGHLMRAGKTEWIAIPSPVAVATPRALQASAGDDRVAAIVQREINAFVLESFGKFLKPAILEAVRREVDSSFSEERLSMMLGAWQVPAAAGHQLPMAEPAAPSPRRVAAPSTGISSAASISRRDLTVPSVEDSDDLERVIQIIMAATGYERHEIEPDMDIRQDLAIRSSRLPVIMDAAEREFGITIKLEDFIGLRTVRDFAGRISELAQSCKASASGEAPASLVPLAVPVEPSPEASPAKRRLGSESLKRFVFEEEPLGQATMKCLRIKAGYEVAVMALSELNLADKLATLLKDKLKAHPLRLNLANEFDLRTPEGTEAAVKRLTEAQSLAGFVLVVDKEVDAALPDMAVVPPLLTGVFRCLQTLMRSREKAFCLLIQRDLNASGPVAAATAGVEGMLLAAALEYPSVLFRTVALDTDTDLPAALDMALDTSQSLLQVFFHGQQAFTSAAKVRPIPLNREPTLRLNPGDVVVISGGGRGITSHLAIALAPFRPNLVLLGRSELDPEVDYEALIAASPVDDEVRRLVEQKNPRPKGKKLEAEVSRLLAAIEITRTLRDLKRRNVEASYYHCDVADPHQVSEVMEQVVKRYGRIDGIIHGAGVVRDSFMEFMSGADFARVMEVKLSGVWNLYRFSLRHGLRFMVGLTSVVAVTGNIGQLNYCAANRALAAFLSGVSSGDGRLLSKALMFPSIEGAGMADNPEIRELLELKGMGQAYVHVAELSEFFCRELFLAPHSDVWVMLARTLPEVKTTRVDLKELPQDKGEQSSAGVSFQESDLPMIQACHRLDIKKGELEAGRTFSQKHDLWLEDHRPLKFLKNPLVSGVMAVETFLEAAHLLHPHLRCLGVRQVRYKDFLEIPPDLNREVRIVCRSEAGPDQVLCKVSISSLELSPSGRQLDRWCTNFEGQVALKGATPTLLDWPDFKIRTEMFDTNPISSDEVMDLYEKRSGLRGRYRVIEAVEGSGPGIVRGSMIYRESHDFAGLENIQYQYSPYLLEAFMHLINVYVMCRNENETRIIIPTAIGELRFARRCLPGEKVILEARLRSENAEGFSWDARGLDEDGTTIMEVEELSMKWVSE
jgi:acyl transferase domain-containing protein/NAD(P)H-dependent flavin oxidoreductase YrpB (nitropropane dioxygenase family)/NAD(P)-dependent dehydrogenase (short-subunit alcohol dehydrogenase family)/acyl carrier protein/3-hydroxymyristoyl/3-hydroxydecanoyl-(acyl carrier protein) dehydratase